MKSRSRTLCIFAVPALLFLFTGCITNHYSRNYVSAEILSGENHKQSKESRGRVVLRLSVASTNEDAESEFKDFIEDGYVFLGSSAFSSGHCPWSCAIDQAEKVKADLVLLRENFLRTETRTGITFTPSTSYSYSHGTINTFSSGPVYYSGTTTTTTMTAVPYLYNVDVFKQQAHFFEKRKPESSFYGALLNIPKFLPGDKDTDPVTVTVWAVLKNTRARKDGIRRGDVVESINGRVIKQRSDLRPFTENNTVITRITVKSEKK